MSKHDAYRAAGQPYAAAVLGVPIKSVDINGIELNWPANCDLSYQDWLAEIGMGLSGIAAVDRYSFGTDGEGRISFDHRTLNELQREDFKKACDLADEIDPGNKDKTMSRAWIWPRIWFPMMRSGPPSNGSPVSSRAWNWTASR